MLYGRVAEQSAIESLLDAAAPAGSAGERRSGVLVVRGEPGVGKTALLEHAVGAARAAGLRVLRAAGVQAEADLPFAALQLLLAPALDRLPALPAPQRQALERAFGLAEGAAPAGGRLLVGLGVLGLLAELAESGPLLCVVDDVQWCDAASVEALQLAARRLGAEGVVLLLAAREGEDAPTLAGLPELRLRGLDEAAASELLAQRAPGLDAVTRRHLLELAHGNPLALHELPAAEERGDGALPLVGRLQLAYHGQLSRLPAATQTLLLVAAAEETGELMVVLDAAARLGASAADLQPAEEAALVAADASGRLAFRHPLLRSAALSRAPLTQRLAVHAALAEALAARESHGDDAPVRRAWHLAQAAVGPDEPTAAELEAAARLASGRGGHAGAAAAFERAARLSPDPVEATRRLVEAAEAATEGGEVERAEQIARRAMQRPPEDPVQLAHLMFIQALGRLWRGAAGPAHRLMLETSDLVADAYPGPAARVLLYALDAAAPLGPGALAETDERLAALRMPASDGLTPVVGYLLDDGSASLPEALAAARRQGAIVPVDLVQACATALRRGQDEEALAVTEEVVAEARAGGFLAVLPTLLLTLAEAELLHGRPAQAQAHAEESLALAGDIGQLPWVTPAHSLLAWLAAQRGDEDACRAALRAADAAARGSGPAQPGASWRAWAEGLLELGQGRAEEALKALEPLVQGAPTGLRAVPDAVEAAVRLRQGERLTEAVDALSRWAEQADRDWARALVARCRALLASADGEAGSAEEVEALWTEALRLHAGTGRPWDEARTALLHGEWLRRARRKAEARTPLRASAHAFDALAAAPWSDRARAELDATGSTPEPRAPGPLAGLTPQESQIVRLAASGLSNRDIAAQLFLSARTVGYHLYKAYPKLGVASRGELAALLEPAA